MALAAACGVSSGADGTGTPDGGAAGSGGSGVAGASGDAAVDGGDDADADTEAVRAKLVRVGYAIDHTGELTGWGHDWDASLALPAGPFVDASGGCALRPTGELVCWNSGKGPDGLFQQIACDGGFDAHCCAVRLDGSMACWDGSAADGGDSAPPGGTYLQVSAGGGFSCGIRTDRTLTCWGLGRPGQVCPPNYTCDGQATPPAGTFTELASFSYGSCAIRTDGTLACWGGAGDVPAGTFLDVSLGTSGWYGITSVCGVRTDGSIACWASADTVDDYLVPQPQGTFVQVVANGWAACALRADNTLVCWGNDKDGYVSQAPASL